MHCVSLFKNNNRCMNYRVGNSYHCELLHREKAKKLYLKYKALQNQCEKLNLDSDDIVHVESCYILYNKAYKARQKHRLYSFCDEYYDEGHNYQFELLESLIKQCEILLEKLYATKKAIDLNHVTDIMTGNGNELHVINNNRIYQNEIVLWRLFRCNLQKNCDEYIQKCICENEEYNKEKYKLTTHLEKAFNLLFCDNSRCTIFYHTKLMVKKLKPNNKKVLDVKIDPIIFSKTRNVIEFIDDTTKQKSPFDDDVISVIGILLYQFVQKLIDIDYFGKYICKADKIILRLDTINFVEYLNRQSVPQLKNIFNIVVFHKKEIQYMSSEIINRVVDYYYTSEKTSAIVIEGYVVWSENCEDHMFCTGEPNTPYRMISETISEEKIPQHFPR